MRNVIHNIQYKTYIHFEQLLFSSITVNEDVKNCTKYLKNCTYTYKIYKKKCLAKAVIECLNTTTIQVSQLFPKNQQGR